MAPLPQLQRGYPPLTTEQSRRNRGCFSNSPTLDLLPPISLQYLNYTNQASPHDNSDKVQHVSGNAHRWLIIAPTMFSRIGGDDPPRVQLCRSEATYHTPARRWLESLRGLCGQGPLRLADGRCSRRGRARLSPLRASGCTGKRVFWGQLTAVLMPRRSLRSWVIIHHEYIYIYMSQLTQRNRPRLGCHFETKRLNCLQIQPLPPTMRGERRDTVPKGSSRLLFLPKSEQAEQSDS